MASNMWSAVERNCEVCGEEIGSELEDEYEEDGSPCYLKGSTIEDEEGNYLTVCQVCLEDIVRKDWKGLIASEE